MGQDIRPPEHTGDEILDGIEWRIGLLAALKDYAEHTSEEEMVNNIDVLEQILDYYGLTMGDIFKGRDHYSWHLPWNHMYQMEEIFAEIVLWLDPEDQDGIVNGAWIQKKLEEELR